MLAWAAVLLLALVASRAENPNLYCNTVPSFVVHALPNATLNRLVLITRHGDRVPVNTSPWKPDNVVWNCSLDLQYSQSEAPGAGKRLFRKRYIAGRQALAGNCLDGQLTRQGALQHQTLGRNLRAGEGRGGAGWALAVADTCTVRQRTCLACCHPRSTHRWFGCGPPTSSGRC